MYALNDFQILFLLFVFIQVSDGPGAQVLSVVHHPHRNLIATTLNNECIKLWRP